MKRDEDAENPDGIPGTLRVEPPRRTEIDARYGHTTGHRRRNRIIALVTAAAFAVVLVSWVIWAGLDGDSAQIDAQDTGHTVIDEHRVSVQFLLTVPRGDAVTCALQAQNAKFAIVGWKIVQIPASSDISRTITEELRTSEMAVTGLIYRCWLA